MKMHDQDDALSDTPKALLSLLLIILTSSFDLSNRHVYRYRTTFSFFIENALIFLKIMKIKNPYLFVPYIYIPRTVTEDAREQF